MPLAHTRRVFLVACPFALIACGGDASSSIAPDRIPPSHDAAHDADGLADANEGRGPVCDPRKPQCASGEKCVTTRWNLNESWPAPRCVPEVGARGAKEREVCFSASGIADTCGPSLACASFGTGEGFCLRTCASGEACGDEEVCAEVDESSGFRLCLPTCVEDPDCNAPGWLACVERDGLRYCDAARARR